MKALMLGIVGVVLLMIGIQQGRSGTAYTGRKIGLWFPANRASAPFLYWSAVAGSLLLGFIMILISISMALGYLK